MTKNYYFFTYRSTPNKSFICKTIKACLSSKNDIFFLILGLT